MSVEKLLRRTVIMLTRQILLLAGCRGEALGSSTLRRRASVEHAYRSSASGEFKQESEENNSDSPLGKDRVKQNVNAAAADLLAWLTTSWLFFISVGLSSLSVSRRSVSIGWCWLRLRIAIGLCRLF